MRELGLLPEEEPVEKPGSGTAEPEPGTNEPEPGPDEPEPDSEPEPEQYGGLISITTPAESTGTGWSFSGNAVTIENNGNYTIFGTTAVNRVVVKSGVTANITLNNVNIDVSGTAYACAFDMSNATVNLTLASGSENTLKSGESRAGLQVPAGAALSITGGGALTATGGNYAAGIGGGLYGSGGNITINGGKVAATASNAAAIGGGGFYSNTGGSTASGKITISGGVVTAYTTCSKNQGRPAAIGSTGAGAVDITISGGAVIAIGGANNQPAIAGGQGSTSGAITISGGTIIGSSPQIAYGIGLSENGYIQTTITGDPVIFATAVNGQSSNLSNGIAIGNDVTINAGADGATGTVTLTNHSSFSDPARSRANAALAGTGWSLTN